MDMSTLQGRNKACVEKLELRAGDAVLDIGCGKDGSVESYAAKSGCYLIAALDIHHDSIKKAKSSCDEGRVSFILGNTSSLPFKDNAFNKIIMLEVLEHVPLDAELTALKEIWRVLKKEGMLVISVPSKRLPAILLDPAFYLISHRHYESKEIEDKLQGAGFSIATAESYGGIKQATWMVYII